MILSQALFWAVVLCGGAGCAGGDPGGPDPVLGPGSQPVTELELGDRPVRGGPVTGFVIGLDGRGPCRGGDLQHVFVERFGDHHADRVGHPTGLLARARKRSRGCRRRSPCGPVVMWSDAVLEPTSQRLPAGGGRRRAHRFRPVRGRGRQSAGDGRRSSSHNGLGTMRTEWPAGLSPEAVSVSIRRETVGAVAIGPKTAGSHRNIATSARQSPPSTTARATSRRALPGSWTARGFRHGARARDMAWSRPGLRTVSANRFDEQDRPGPGDNLAAVVLNAEILAGRRHFLLP